MVDRIRRYEKFYTILTALTRIEFLPMYQENDCKKKEYFYSVSLIFLKKLKILTLSKKLYTYRELSAINIDIESSEVEHHMLQWCVR